MKDVVCLILGGGQGSRLFPLTKDRSKPAVPIGGKYRLIDIPISNSMNSDINKILILTQFNSASLNKHVNHAFRFDQFHEGFVDILAAEQSMEHTGWYQGTADAVRKSVKHFASFPGVKYVLILSGDQIYTMDFRELLRFHKEQQADISLSVLPCSAADARGFGIMRLEGTRISAFTEKPDEAALAGPDWDSSSLIQSLMPTLSPEKKHLASMGIYVFNLQVLLDLLDTGAKDFGRDIIPQAIGTHRVSGFLFNGYWEDVGTIGSFHRANMDFIGRHPGFDFHQTKIFTHARYLPPCRIQRSEVNESLICEGSRIEDALIDHSVIGIRSVIQRGCRISRSYMLGADWFQSEEQIADDLAKGRVPVGLGRNCEVRNAILDKNCRVGDNCRLVNEQNLDHADGPCWYIRDHIVIVPKGVEVPPGTVV